MQPTSPFEFGRDLLDVLLVTLLLWGGLLWLRKTRALPAFLGLTILAVIYLVARQLGLDLTAWIFQGFSAVVLILIVVVFQEDLRRLLEQIGAWGLGRRPEVPTSDVADVVVRAVARLAQDRTGALLVMPGREPLDRHLEGGIRLDGALSEPLLLSLFDAHSPGHDGAVVIAGDRVVSFAVHLPLSADQAQLGPGGTRHAAGLGLAERADALCVVVSEERGTVSVARDGTLRTLGTPGELARLLRAFQAEIATSGAARPARGRWLRAWPYPLLSLGIAATLWFLLVPGSTVVEAQREARVTIENVPQGYEIESVDPQQVTLTLSGPRRVLYFGPPDLVQVKVDALLAQLGRRTFVITPDEVEHPPHIEVLKVTPSQVKISLKKTAETSRAQ